MILTENTLLAEYTTFKIGGPARFFCRVQSEEGVVEAVRLAKEKKLPIFVLGGGSNLLISDEGFAGLVIKMEQKGILIGGIGDGSVVANEDLKSDNKILVTAAAGELWDDLVERTVSAGLHGLENLSAIPGTVGAAPVQNIGAYGSEVSQVIDSVRVYDLQKETFLEFSNEQCQFAYRDSIFKRQKGRWIVTRVSFRLDASGRANISYKDLADYFVSKNIPYPSLLEVREAVIQIRWGKLPDWRLWGTAGSFFKNPIVSEEKFLELKAKYPDLPGFKEPDSKFKVSLGWILDKVCRVKGLCIGNACTYEKQALVVVTKPGATSAEVVNLTKELMDRVRGLTGLEISAEVEWVN